MKKYFLLTIFLSFAANAKTCLVTKVMDGDTIKVTCDGEEVKVRLANIDAPEKKQPFGIDSKKMLENLCLNQDAKILGSSKGRYKRLIAEVQCKGINVNRKLVESGLAWVYRDYNKDAQILCLEYQARHHEKGLWAQKNPVAPWDFRKKKKAMVK